MKACLSELPPAVPTAASLAPQVLTPDGELVDMVEVLGEGKYIGLYFSASW